VGFNQYVRSRNVKNEEDLAGVGLLRQMKRNTSYFFFSDKCSANLIRFIKSTFDKERRLQSSSLTTAIIKRENVHGGIRKERTDVLFALELGKNVAAS
jgi:hypothetical protein